MAGNLTKGEWELGIKARGTTVQMRVRKGRGRDLSWYDS